MPERARPFQQPEGIRVPAKDDPLGWATLLAARTDWARATAPQLLARGVDASKLILGSVLNAIIFDDRNQYFLIHEGVNDPTAIAIARLNAVERLKWERQTLQTEEMRGIGQ